MPGFGGGGRGGGGGGVAAPTEKNVRDSIASNITPAEQGRERRVERVHGASHDDLLALPGFCLADSPRRGVSLIAARPIP